ncbi:sulfatase [Streptomyces sp. CRN 30]|uniref:sulfatase n=1 Tax=Streptomyces sp. CRN 30 TaxID=3075613 RepID=UPI002A840DCA|nr:sulfatase [Streptomyces sp. CRN 30]
MSLFTRLRHSPAPDEVTADKPVTDDDSASRRPAPRRLRALRGLRAKYPRAARVLARSGTVLAVVAVLFALLMPGNVAYFEPKQFLRIPAEAILGAALLMVLPRRPRRIAAVVMGVGLALVVALKLLDMGFRQFLGRDFDPVLDWGLLDDATSYLQDTAGRTGALGAVVGAVVLLLLLLAGLTLAVLRIAGLMARNRRTAVRTVVTAGAVWITCSALGLQLLGTTPVAARNTVALVEARGKGVRAALRDEAAFAKEARKDAFADVPPDQLLTALRGKDVIFAFVESYGRTAIEDEATAPGVGAVLDAGTESLREAGYSARSGWLTSATYGGSSWLGHSTFLTGLWIDNQNRYRTVTNSERLSLPGAFARTGAWRTVGVMPGVQKNWPEGRFYGFDRVYDSRDLGYRGPKFSWSTMPDQYALTAFERLEHGREQDKPLMSQLILTSSHQPWAPLPKMVDWADVGDGSVYEDIEKAGKDPAKVFSDSTEVKQEYGESIQYSMRSLVEYVERYGTDDTVLVVLGDHEPVARVSGDDGGRDVPISIVAHDPDVLDRIQDWGWADGLTPGEDTPVWRMDAFRDRFLTAYGPGR